MHGSHGANVRVLYFKKQKRQRVLLSKGMDPCFSVAIALIPRNHFYMDMSSHFEEYVVNPESERLIRRGGSTHHHWRRCHLHCPDLELVTLCLPTPRLQQRCMGKHSHIHQTVARTYLRVPLSYMSRSSNHMQLINSLTQHSYLPPSPPLSCPLPPPVLLSVPTNSTSTFITSHPSNQTLGCFPKFGTTGND